MLSPKKSSLDTIQPALNDGKLPNCTFLPNLDDPSLLIPALNKYLSCILYVALAKYPTKLKAVVLPEPAVISAALAIV